MKLNNFIITNLEELLQKEESIVDVFNETYIKNERNNIANKIRETLSTVFDFDGKHSLLLKDLSERVLRFSFLTQLGCCTYITNELFSIGEDIVSNGGFFINEDIEPKELISQLGKNESSFTNRYKYLKDVLNIYSKRVFLPKIAEQLREAQIITKNSLLKSAVSRITNRNSAHHIESHMSHRSTIDKIIDRLGFGNEKSKEHFNSLIEMENRFNRYRSERNDFIAGIDSNTNPITVRFYQDIIVPFVENSLIIDNIAKSEGVHWRKVSEYISENERKGILEGGEVSKLRIRVFYHKNLQLKPQNGNAKAHGGYNGDCKIPLNHIDKTSILCNKIDCNKIQNDVELFETVELGLENFQEICMFYTGVKDQNCGSEIVDTICIHELPYFRQHNNKMEWYKEHFLNCNDIEITMPGTLGKHSWWSILENHIRNTAKHANRDLLNIASHLDIIIKVSPNENDPEFYNVELTSNIPTLETNELKVKGEDGKEVDTTFGKIQKYCKIDISDDKTSSGIADMRINSVLLKFEEITRTSLEQAFTATTLQRNHEIDEKLKYKKDDNGNNIVSELCKFKYSLCYFFKMTRPCKVVIIDSSNNFNLDDYSDVNKGIYAYKDYSQCITELSRKRRAFQFAVIHSDVFKDVTLKSSIGRTYGAETNPQAHEIDKLLQVLPWRVIVYGGDNDLEIGKRVCQIKGFSLTDNKFKKKSNEPNAATEILNYCWEQWMKSCRWGSKKFSLSFYFEQDLKKVNEQIVAVEPTKRYFDKSQNFKSDILKTFIFGNNISDDLKFDKQIVNTGFNYPDYKFIIYDRHGRICYDHLKTILGKSDFPAYCKENDNLSWFYIDKNNADFDEMISNPLINSTEHFFKYAEAGLHRILIIDERVREYALNSSAHSNVALGKDTFIEESKIGGVFIADSLIIDNEEILFESTSTKKFEVKLISSENNWKVVYTQAPDIIFDTIIIHRTMLDKMVKKEGLFNYLAQTFPNILVCTGGGTLSFDEEIMKRIRKISYFALAKYINNGNVAKNNIINLL